MHGRLLGLKSLVCWALASTGEFLGSAFKGQCMVIAQMARYLSGKLHRLGY